MEQLNQPEEHEGTKWLDVLDMGHLADETITRKDGSTLLAKDFLDVCRDDALDALVGFASLSPEDPRHAKLRTILRSKVFGLMGREPEE